MSKVNQDTIIAEVISMDRGTIPILMKSGMHCIGCPSASGESLGEACAVHGIDVDKLVQELNDFLENK